MPAVQLRPFGFGEILDTSFNLYRHHFVTLVLTTLLLVVPLSLVSGIFSYQAVLMQQGQTGAGAMLWIFLLMLLSLVGFLLAWAALTRQTAQAVTGGPVSLGDGLMVGLRKLLPLLGAGILIFLGIFAAMMLIGIVLGMFAAFLIPGTSETAGAVVAVATTLIMMLVTLLVGAMFFAVVPAIVVEDLGPFAALKRSWQLARGAPFRVLGILFVTWLIVLLPTLGLMLVTGLGASLLDPAAAFTTSSGQLVLQQVIGAVAYALTIPFLVASMLLLYYDRRVRTDAYDLELQAQGLAISG